MNSTTEWSVAFDVLYNNILSNQAPGLTEYEKSLFLTRAQNNLVKEVFDPKSNQLLEGFDGTPIRQSDFSSLIVTGNLTVDNTITDKIDKRSKCFTYPSAAVLAMLNEQVYAVGSGSNPEVLAEYAVVPISYEEYARLMKKPYKYPPKDVAWRLINKGSDQFASSATYAKVELIGKFASNDLQYYVRYVTWPDPIILETWSGSLKIEGAQTEDTCHLPPHLHDEILQRAVLLAKVAWEDSVPTSSAVR